jgi:hypothetical protein
MGLQSDSRVPGRGGEPRPRSGRGLPPSYGRPTPEEPVEAPKPSPVSVVDGRVVLEVGAKLVIDQEAAQAFYDSVRDLTQLAIRDGYAAAMGRAPADVEPPPDAEAKT